MAAIKDAIGADQSSAQVLRLRDMPMEPAHGFHKSVAWLQYVGSLQLRLPLQGPDWSGVQAEDVQVKLTETELQVKCQRDSAGSLEELCAKLKKDVDPTSCSYGLEVSSVGQEGRHTSVLVINLVKKQPGQPWPNGVLSRQMFNNRQYFGWTPNGQPTEDTDQAEAQRWVVLPSGLRRDVEDPYVTCRSWLCKELEQWQTQSELQFRLTLSQKTFNDALEKTPYYKLWGVDVSDRYLKLFIRGDEPSPVLLGELGGACIPERTTLELSSVTRQVEGHRIAGTVETLPCLVLKLQKHRQSMGEWQELLSTRPSDMSGPVGSLEDYMRRHTKREVSPDRSAWTPEEWALENKAHADKAFKEGDYSDAAVYYTRALQRTHDNEKLLCNRSAAYLKLSKFQAALDDALKAEELCSGWAKVYFRKGLAMRALHRFEEASVSFHAGHDLDPGNADWDKELRRTEEQKAAFEVKKSAIR